MKVKLKNIIPDNPYFPFCNGDEIDVTQVSENLFKHEINHKNGHTDIFEFHRNQLEFMQPKLAGREYDLELIRAYKKWQDGTIQQFIEHRYAKQDRISEIKEQIEKLSNELKELEG